MTAPMPFRPLSYTAAKPSSANIWSFRNVSAGGLSLKPTRSKTWQLSSYLHCSIIGTCLTTGELRRLCAKLGDAEAAESPEHELHSIMVRTAAKADAAAKQLNKLLDAKHARVLRKFNAVTDPVLLRKAWEAAVTGGDIAGAYWAILSHAHVDQPLVRDVYGEVHMLSHLVGRSSRLDLARLRQLEIELEAREERIAHQQARLQDAAAQRGRLQAEITDLRSQLARSPVPSKSDKETQALKQLGNNLMRQLEQEKRHGKELEKKLEEALAANTQHSAGRARLEARVHVLTHEVEVLESALDSGTSENTSTLNMEGRTILYVGGRPGLLNRLKRLSEQMGAELIAHDGGIEDGTGLLPGGVSRADFVLFPVDCVSHQAALQVKKLAQAAGKPFLPVPNASVAAFLTAISTLGELAV